MTKFTAFPLAAAAIAAALVLTACSGGGEEAPGGGASDGTPVLLGATSAETGATSAICTPVTGAMKATIESINDDGGANGHPIDWRLLDDAYEAPNALANARELADDGVVAFFGGCGSIQPPAVGQISAQTGIPYLFPQASTPSLIEGDNFLSLYPNFADQYVAITNWAIDEKGPGKVLFITAQVPGVEDTIAALKEAVDDAGGEWAEPITYVTGDDANFASMVLKVQEIAPDYVTLGITGQDTARLANELAVQNALPDAFLSHGVAISAPLLESAGEVLEGKLFTAEWLPTADSTEAEDCAAILKEYAPALVLDKNSLGGCAFTQVIAHAISQVDGEVTGESLMAEFRTWKDEEATPLLLPLTFDGQNVGYSELTVGTITDGQPAKVEGVTIPLPKR